MENVKETKSVARRLRSVIAATCLVVSGHAGAAEILFAFVQDNDLWVNDGIQLASFLSSAGHNVSQRRLDDAVYGDYATFDQIWVYDLERGANNNATQASNYTGIADWFNNRSDQNLIVDGRIVSSAPFWTSANGMSSEEGWIRNYATQLDLRGGGAGPRH